MKNEAMWIWLSRKCGIASRELSTLIERLGSIDTIYEADYDTYIDAGISERLAEDLCEKSLGEANGIIDHCQVSRAGILCYDDEKYPSKLRAIQNPPAVLYYLGTLPDFNKNLYVSVVGTRKMTEYGMSAAYKIAYEMASAGAVVVSGMALGIDGVASAAAIAAGGKTVVVLGCGIDVVYPKEHLRLEEKIRKNGVIITEYPPAMPPKGSHFPIRNRIISGLSQATVVIEADIDSGAMITARNAIVQGKDIYAVPSNIDTVNSSGTNSLIRDGAQAVMCGNDIIKHYAFAYGDKLNVKKMHNAESRSELDEKVLAEMGVGARAGRSAEPKPSREYVNRGSVAGRGAEKTKRVENKERPYAEAGKKTFGYKSNLERELFEARPMHKAENAEDAAPYKNSAVHGDDAAQYKNGAEQGEGDKSRAVLDTLSEKQRRVFDEMPLDFPVTVDYLTKTGISLGEVMSALTVLEIKGLVFSLPGAIYMRK